MPAIGPGAGRARRRQSVPEAAFRGARRPYLVSRVEGDAALLSIAPVTKTIVVATKSKYATSARAATTLDSAITRHLVQIGPASATELQLEVNNWWLLATVAEEQVNSGALSVEASLTDLVSGLSARLKFGGSNIGSVPVTAGAARLVSDALLPATFGLVLFPAASRWLLTIRRTAASTADSLPWHSTNQTLTRELEFEYQYASAASDAGTVAAAYLDAAPALSQYSQMSGTIVGLTSAPTRPNPGASGISVAGGFVLLGKCNAPTRAIVFVGDSISDGTADVQTPVPTDFGNGWVGRCLAGPDGLPIGSSIKATCSGDRAQYRAAARTLSRNAYRQGNLGVIALGVNDLAGGRTFAQLRSDVYGIAADMKADGIRKVCVATITPKTTSTDGWASAANQAYFSTAFQPDDARDQFNAQIKADASAKANNIDGVIDFAAAVEDAANPGKWKPLHTADGTHPLATGHIAMAGIARSTLMAVAPALA